MSDECCHAGARLRLESEMNSRDGRMNTLIKVLRWTARTWSVGGLLLVLAMLTGEADPRILRLPPRCAVVHEERTLGAALYLGSDAVLLHRSTR